MKGIAKGEVSSSSNPVLQLFCRGPGTVLPGSMGSDTNGYLSDMVSGTYKIESIIGNASPVSVVATASFDIVADRIGAGRYVIKTGTTSSWAYGTYRAVCTYKMAAGGADITQVIEFEVLDPADWPTGNMFMSYISTRDLVRDGLVASATSLARLHRMSDRISRQIERWCGGRCFEPRYMILKRSGQNNPVLRLPEAVIAIEDVYSTWETSTGTDDYKYEQYLYVVYNRHLDGPNTVDDDRYNPKLELSSWQRKPIRIVSTSLPSWPAGYYTWPAGVQNIRVQGVFGFTDPEFDPSNTRSSIGKTPRDISFVAGVLVGRAVQDPTFSDPSVQRPGAVKSMKTRDQSIEFGSGWAAASGSVSFGMTGDPMLDGLLVKYAPPPTLVGV